MKNKLFLIALFFFPFVAGAQVLTEKSLLDEHRFHTNIPMEIIVNMKSKNPDQSFFLGWMKAIEIKENFECQTVSDDYTSDGVTRSSSLQNCHNALEFSSTRIESIKTCYFEQKSFPNGTSTEKSNYSQLIRTYLPSLHAENRMDTMDVSFTRETEELMEATQVKVVFNDKIILELANDEIKSEDKELISAAKKQLLEAVKNSPINYYKKEDGSVSWVLFEDK